MKFAALSDIHGNIDALDAVVADASARGITRFVNLGDICSGPLFPVQTLERLIPLDWPTIRGNHERQVLEQPREAMGLSDQYAAEQLDTRHREWLSALPVQRSPYRDVLMVHGTPSSDLEYYLHTVTPEGLRSATEQEIHVRTGSVPYRLILCGHTHLQAQHRLPDSRLIVNPGSVGLQAYDDTHPHPHLVENDGPEARYAILTLSGGEWSAQFLSVPYDTTRAVRQAEHNQRPDWTMALKTGRMR